MDYLSKWPVVKRLGTETSSKSVIYCLKEVFSDFGQPEIVVSDNGPQFSSAEFKSFCNKYGIRHNTSSPVHPSGNGQAERTIGTLKNIMKKCWKDTGGWLQGLLTLRNTPISEGLPSPSELLQGRILRDSHPVRSKRYEVTGYDINKVRQALGDRKSTDKYYHNRHARSEKAILLPGQQVHTRTAKGEWRSGEIVGVTSDRSYLVDSKNIKLRRNRKDLRRTAVDITNQMVSHPILTGSQEVQGATGKQSAVAQLGDQVLPPGTLNSQSDNLITPLPESTALTPDEVTRSGRRTQKPKWHDDYHFYK